MYWPLLEPFRKYIKGSLKKKSRMHNKLVVLSSDANTTVKIQNRSSVTVLKVYDFVLVFIYKTIHTISMGVSYRVTNKIIVKTLHICIYNYVLLRMPGSPVLKVQPTVLLL